MFRRIQPVYILLGYGGSLIVLSVVVMLSLIGLTTAAQSGRFERHFQTFEDPKINVVNASHVYVDVWEKNEVVVVAEADKGKVSDDEVKVRPSKSKLDVFCQPTASDKEINVNLLVPVKALLNVTGNNSKIELKELRDAMTIGVIGNKVTLTSYGHEELDLTNVAQAVLNEHTPGRSPVSHSLTHRRLGESPPFVKIDATDAQQVVIDAYPLRSPLLPLTLAGLTIAAQDSIMGKTLRRTYPRLAEAVKRWGDPSSTGSSAAGIGSDSARVRAREDGSIKLETQLVNLNVAVTDKQGKAVPSLKPEDFSVYEDGVLQPVSHFSQETEPFNVMLVLDISGKLPGEIGPTKQAAQHFLDTISLRDKVAIAVYAVDATVIAHLTDDREELHKSIRGLRVPNLPRHTLFYDALGYWLIEEFHRVRGQRNALVVVNDGLLSAIWTFDRQSPAQPDGRLPWSSYLTFEMLLEGIKEENALIYPISLEYDDESRKETIASAHGNGPLHSIDSQIVSQAPTTQSELRKLAEVSGGVSYNAKSAKDLNGVYEQVAAQLRSVYSLAYTPINQNFDGKFRNIRVQVNPPDVIVRTRTGYYASK